MKAILWSAYVVLIVCVAYLSSAAYFNSLKSPYFDCDDAALMATVWCERLHVPYQVYYGMTEDKGHVWVKSGPVYWNWGWELSAPKFDTVVPISKDRLLEFVSQDY